MNGPRQTHPGRTRQRGFLDFSFPELVITFGVALVVLGPKKLPGLVGQIGRWVGRARVMARQFREQLEQEVNSVNSAVNVVQPVSNPPPVNPAPVATAAPEASATASAPAGTDTTSAAAPAAQSFHADSPTHFRLDGTTPAVSYSNPLDDSADAAEPVTPPSAEGPAAPPAQDATTAKS